MSESESYEEVTVASDGITVIKTFEEDAFPVPAIAFRIQSDRTESVTVTLVDDVPENVAVEDLGFHPEYGSEFWTIEDDEITFEREIQSEEQYTTVYGIRATGTDNIEQFLTEPDIADVDPPLEDDDGVVGGGSDVVRDVISGDTDSVPGLDEEDDDIGTLDLADPNEEGQQEEEEEEEDEQEAEADDEDDDEEEEVEQEVEADEDDEESEAQPETNGQVANIESVAAALADEIREGDVDDEDMDVLREELEIEVAAGGGGGGGGTEGGATDARIQKLQTDVSDLEAYIDALEEFLEENGTGQDLIDDVQTGLEDVQGQLDDIQSNVEDNSEQVNSLDDGLDEFEDDLRSLKGDIKDLDDSLEDVEGTLGTVKDDVEDIDDIESRVDDIDQDIEELQEWREQLSNVLGAADG